MIASLCALLLSAALFTLKVFGDVTFSQILFNIRTSGVDTGIVMAHVKPAIRYILLAAAMIAVIWASALLALRKPRFKDFYLAIKEFVIRTIKRLASPRLLVVLLLIAFSVAAVKTVDRKFQIKRYLKQEDSPFFADNYARLDLNDFTHVNGNKRNLIVLFLESIEAGYSEPHAYGTNLIPELSSLREEGLHFEGYRKTPGGYFTIDGISAQTTGMPITQLPMDIHDFKNERLYGGMLNNSPGIFNLLKKDGYETVSFSGISASFTQMRTFLHNHGIDTPLHKEDWQAQGYALNDSTRGRWDYCDRFLVERMKAYLSQPKDKPFGVLFQSIDTHFPVGWAPDMSKRDGHEKAVRYLDHLIGDFVQWAKTQPWYANTTIVILGDHPWQDFANDFTKRTQQAKDRSVFNVILNPVMKNPKVPACGFTAMDMAPTILNAMGVNFTSVYQGEKNHARLGIGTSLFSEEENLVCRLGVESLTDNVNRFSSFYNELHMKPNG